MAEVAISLPFSIDPYGKVASTINQSKIWSDRVRSIIGTTLRERVMRPTLGTIVPYALFESATTSEAEVKSEISKAFQSQLSLLRLQNVTVNIDEYTNVLNATIVYDLPNNETVTTNIGLILISGTKPAYEETL
jgi:phage baseplate assembly protein W